MGRKPTTNLNLPPHMRKRVRGERIYYFFDTGDKPRREISLGSDYISALAKYAELNVIEKVQAPTFGDAIDRYKKDELPKLAKNTQKIFRYDIQHVEAYFRTAPLDQIRPVHIRKFLDKHRDKPTTANRCKRLFSNIFNHARGWGYTDAQNPCEGIRGHSLDKRTVYVSDDLFNAVYMQGSQSLRDAMDLAYLTGQRPGDTLSMTEDDIVDGYLIIEQEKTKQPLRIVISGKLKQTIKRIQLRKNEFNIVTNALLVNEHGKRMTPAVLRNHFTEARQLATAANPDLEQAIKNFWFYDLRAKAADDTSEARGDQAASDLLGHDSVKTTKRHYLRRGKIVSPTK
jgi:integrase